MEVKQVIIERRIYPKLEVTVGRQFYLKIHLCEWCVKQVYKAIGVVLVQ